MNLHDAERLAGKLMNDHGLFKTTDPYGGLCRPWRFVWDTAKRRLGQCRHAKREIGLSHSYALLNPEHLVRDTILHEIAHALVGPWHKHDRTWKLRAVSIGAQPQACKSNAIAAPHLYSAQCRCGLPHSAHRRRTNLVCRRCKDPLRFTAKAAC